MNSFDIMKKFSSTQEMSDDEYFHLCGEIFDPLAKYEGKKWFVKSPYKSDEDNYEEKYLNWCRSECFHAIFLSTIKSTGEARFTSALRKAAEKTNDADREYTIRNYCKGIIRNFFLSQIKKDIRMKQEPLPEDNLLCEKDRGEKELFRRTIKEIASELEEKVLILDRGKNKFVHYFLYGGLWFKAYRIKDDKKKSYTTNDYIKKFSLNTHVYDVYKPQLENLLHEFKSGIYNEFKKIEYKGRIERYQKVLEPLDDLTYQEVFDYLREKHAEKKPEFIERINLGKE